MAGKRPGKAKGSHNAPTPQLVAFVEAYCTPGTEAFGHSGKAALKAGYGKGTNWRSAVEHASRLRRQPRVQQMIAERLADAGITRDTIVLHVARFFFSAKTAADVARTGKLLAEMTPNALAPQKLDINAKATIVVADPYAKEK